MELAATHAPPATDWKDQLPLYFAGGASAAAVVSIAASQILLGLAILSLIATGRRPRWLPIYPALITWFGLTVISALFSGHARGGLPQIKKFYVYLMLVVVSTAFRKLSEIRVLAFTWAAAASASSAWSVVQFVRKLRSYVGNGADFYTSYVSDRVTGFMDHWMTFSGEMMMALLIVGAVVLFSQSRKGVAWLYPAGLLILVGLVAAFTRSMWVGAAAGGAFLLWSKRPWLVLTIPVAALLLVLANPFQLRDRVVSVFQPHGDLDSNAHRALTRQVGWEMIKAHPLLGVGPEQVGPQFESYLPPGFIGPLPRGYYGHLHNIYYHYAAERGIPALLALLWLLGRAFYDFARTLRVESAMSEKRWVLFAAIAVSIAVMLSGYEEVNLGDSEVLAMFLAVVACGYVAVSPQSEQV